MNKSIFLRVILFCTLGSVLSHGQDYSNEVPVGNPVQFPKGSAEWIVDIAYKTPATQAGSDANSMRNMQQRLLKIVATQSDALLRTMATWNTGKKTETWLLLTFNVYATTATSNGEPLCISGQNGFQAATLATGFEPSVFQWVDRSNYVDTIALKGQKCWHYRKKVEVASPLDPRSGPPPVHEMEAWVDKETRLPVAIYDGNRTGVYVFAKNRPAEPLKLPKPIEDEYRLYMGTAFPENL